MPLATMSPGGDVALAARRSRRESIVSSPGWSRRSQSTGRAPVLYELPDVNGPTKLVSLPVLGGLHHIYERVAA
jgi:hypothetical protein